MARARKWDFEGHECRPYEIPDDWFCVLNLFNMDTIINCASCGKKLAFGDSYTSRSIHNDCGFGYAICADCMTKEYMAESGAFKENEQ